MKTFNQIEIEEYAALCARVFLKVQTHMKWDIEKTSLWFKTENPHIGNCTPSDYIARRPDKAEKWIDHLIDEGKGPE